jgi:SNF2 family DNA or RNA helicase
VKRRILIADSRTSKSKFEAADIVIANYDILPKHLDWHKGIRDEGTKKQVVIVDKLGSLEFEWDAVFTDESHLILNSSTQRGACAQALLGAGVRRGAITGTPLLNQQRLLIVSFPPYQLQKF